MNHEHRINPETGRLVGDENAYEALASMLEEQDSDDKPSEAA